MIDKKQEAKERFWQRRGVVYRKHGFFFPLYAALSFFLPFMFAREVEPFTVKAAKCETPSPEVNRFSGWTYKRIKKVENFFAYGWIKHDKRIQRSAI
jgi:hypothetical protein